MLQNSTVLRRRNALGLSSKVRKHWEILYTETLMVLFFTVIFFLSSASRDESSEDRQTVSHVSPTEPWAVDGLGLPFAPCAL